MRCRVFASNKLRYLWLVVEECVFIINADLSDLTFDLWCLAGMLCITSEHTIIKELAVSCSYYNMEGCEKIGECYLLYL